MKNSVLYLFFVIFCSNFCLAQDSQLWTSFSTNGRISKDSPLLLWFDGHTRFSEDVGRLGVSIVRPGLGYKVSDNLSLWAGYAWIVSQASGRANATDNRFWQQATYKIHSGSAGSFSGRTRFESRFLRSGGNTGFRLRQNFKWTYPLAENLYSSFWNETFFALNDTDFGAVTGFDQNRTHLGIGWKSGGNLKVEGGYLFNTINRQSRSNLDNHNFSLAFSVPF